MIILTLILAINVTKFGVIRFIWMSEEWSLPYLAGPLLERVFNSRKSASTSEGVLYHRSQLRPGPYPPLDCEVNCEVDPAYRIRKEQKGGKPTSAFPQLNPTVACYYLLLQPLTRPSQNPVRATS